MIGVHIKQCLVGASSSSFLQKLISSYPVFSAEVRLSRSFLPRSIYTTAGLYALAMANNVECFNWSLAVVPPIPTILILTNAESCWGWSVQNCCNCWSRRTACDDPTIITLVSKNTANHDVTAWSVCVKVSVCCSVCAYIDKDLMSSLLGKMLLALIRALVQQCYF